MKLDPFYLIVDSADWIERLVPLGVKLVQLRIKDCAETELRAEHPPRQGGLRARIAASSSSTTTGDWRSRKVATSSISARRICRRRSRRHPRRRPQDSGSRTHDEAELETALAAEPDYVALGPIYPTILKKMKWAPQGLDRIGEWKTRVGKPAAGRHRWPQHRSYSTASSTHGADSAAVVTDITLNADPEARTREWIERTAQCR